MLYWWERRKGRQTFFILSPIFPEVCLHISLPFPPKLENNYYCYKRLMNIILVPPLKVSEQDLLCCLFIYNYCFYRERNPSSKIAWNKKIKWLNPVILFFYIWDIFNFIRITIWTKQYPWRTISYLFCPLCIWVSKKISIATFTMPCHFIILHQYRFVNSSHYNNLSFNEDYL